MNQLLSSIRSLVAWIWWLGRRSPELIVKNGDVINSLLEEDHDTTSPANQGGTSLGEQATNTQPSTVGLEVLYPILAIHRPNGDFCVTIHLTLLFAAVVGQRALYICTSWANGTLVDNLYQTKSILSPSILWFSSLVLTRIVASLQEFAIVYPRQFSEKRVSDYIQRHIMALDMHFHSNQHSGETQQAAELGTTLSSIIELIAIDCIPQILDLVNSCAFIAIRFDIQMLSICFCLFVISLWTSVWIASSTSNARRTYNDLFFRLVHCVRETIDHWSTIAEHSRTREACQKLSELTRDMQTAERYFLYKWVTCETLHNTLLLLGRLLAYTLAIRCVAIGAVSVGAFVSCVSLLEAAEQRIGGITKSLRQILKQLTDLDRLCRLLETKSVVTELDGARDLSAGPGSVIYEDVTFGYPGQNHPLKVSLEIAGGQTIALVGPSGRGKSTMLKLLGRFYDPVSGAIYIDGESIQQATLHSVRESIAWVPQNPSIFDGTVRYNITYGHAKASDATVETACQAAQIYEKFDDCPLGLETTVGSNGVQLSGGERQRVAIARLLVTLLGSRETRIVVLDEATSALDNETERKVLAGLKEHLKNRTCFIIAHRLSTVRHADKILVINGGRVVEDGTHAELVSKGGEYWTLLNAAEAPITAP